MSVTIADLIEMGKAAKEARRLEYIEQITRRGVPEQEEEDKPLLLLDREIERLRIGNDRYETVRLMDARLFAETYKTSIKTGKPFDQLIDELRPFLRSKGQ